MASNGMPLMTNFVKICQIFRKVGHKHTQHGDLIKLTLTSYKKKVGLKISGRSQWPRGLRRRSLAARLMRSWVRIPPGGMDVCLL